MATLLSRTTRELRYRHIVLLVSSGNTFRPRAPFHCFPPVILLPPCSMLPRQRAGLGAAHKTSPGRGGRGWAVVVLSRFAVFVSNRGFRVKRRFCVKSPPMSTIPIPPTPTRPTITRPTIPIPPTPTRPTIPLVLPRGLVQLWACLYANCRIAKFAYSRSKHAQRDLNPAQGPLRSYLRSAARGHAKKAEATSVASFSGGAQP